MNRQQHRNGQWIRCSIYFEKMNALRKSNCNITVPWLYCCFSVPDCIQLKKIWAKCIREKSCQWVSLVSFWAWSIALGKKKAGGRIEIFVFVLFCSFAVVCLRILRSDEKWEWVADLRWMGQNQFIFVKNKYFFHQKNYVKWNCSSKVAKQYSGQ